MDDSQHIVVVGSYTVTLTEKSVVCNCLDAKMRPFWCKHVLHGILIVLGLQDVEDGYSYEKLEEAFG